MCRLFGSRSIAPDGVAHELLHGSNALRVQSKEHPDGWGLGWYEGKVPRIVRSLSPAHGDGEFEKISAFVKAATVVAHVRRASIGRVAQENTHPFERGRWLFAHNGTVPEWPLVAPLLEAQLDQSLRCQGETDSERCFLYFLTRLSQRCDPERATFAAAAAALSQTALEVRRLAAQIAKPGSAPPSTTFLATDGELLLTCRVGRTLYLSAPEPDAQGRVAYLGVSSEDPGHGAPRANGRAAPWKLLPEDALAGVDGELRLRIGTLQSWG